MPHVRKSKNKSKGRLGQFLLKKFKKRKRPSPKLATKVEVVSHQISEATPVVHAPILPVVAAPVTPEPQVIRLPSIEDSIPIRALVTQDILKPDEKLRNAIEAFLLDQRSPHTRRAYARDLKRLVKFLHVRKMEQGIESLNRSVLIAYKEFLLSEKLEHTTIDRHISCLRSFFQWLVDDGILAKNPAEGVRFLNPKRVSKTIGFSDEEVKKILALPDLHRKTGALHYAILMVLFYCGLRRSEVCELKTFHLGTERNQHVIRLIGKGNAERVIVLIPAVWSAIQHYFRITARKLDQRTESDYLFLPVRNNRTKVLNKPLDPSMIFYIVKKYAKLAGIMNSVSPHSCRATAISNARDHHVPDRAIQEFAGWTSTQMITTYDKRKTAVEDSAAHAISYGTDERALPSGFLLPHPDVES